MKFIDGCVLTAYAPIKVLPYPPPMQINEGYNKETTQKFGPRCGGLNNALINNLMEKALDRRGFRPTI